MPKKIFLANSKNDKRVCYDPHGSHAATHFADTPQLKELSVEIILNTALDKEEYYFDQDMGRIVGKSDLIKNEAEDVIVFAKRKNRDIYSSFNKTKAPQPCSFVTTPSVSSTG